MISAGLIAALVFGMVPMVRASGELAGRPDKIDAIQEEKDRVADKLSELEQKKNNAAEYLTAFNEELSSVEDSVSSLEAQMADTEEAITRTETELKAARETEAGQYEDMKLRIKYMYEKCDAYFLEMMFNSASLSAFLSQAEYISKISEYDRTMLTAYQETKNLIAEKSEQLQTAQADLETMSVRAEAKRESLASLQEAKNEELSSLNVQIADHSDLLADYDEALKEELEEFQNMEEAIRKKEAEEARRAAESSGEAMTAASAETTSETGPTEKVTEKATKAPTKETAAATTAKATTAVPTVKPTQAATSGSFLWPVPSCSRISSGYGGRDDPLTGEANGTLSNHHGIDIAKPSGALAGADIVAAESGTVVIARTSTSAGNWIILYHGNSTYTVYMHCKKLLVSEGQSVSRGQTIGLVGSTGWSTGAHLHFEVRVGGFSGSKYSQNPLNYVSPP
ncbi:MAG: peptidoglycan DD-metalloendopeptidase family protein [Lachnospiraceae bacterium]